MFIDFFLTLINLICKVAEKLDTSVNTLISTDISALEYRNFKSEYVTIKQVGGAYENRKKMPLKILAYFQWRLLKKAVLN